MSWSIDSAHSHIGFSVKHMMVSTVRGKFKEYSGTFNLDAKDFTRSTFAGEISVASIDTGNADRDNHLRSADFFDVEKFPTLTFASTGVTKSKDGYTLNGDLTIHGVTKPVSLELEALGGGKDPWGNDRQLFSAKTSISRSDFGLTWNQALEAGGVLVSDKIEIEVEIQAVGKAG